MNRVALSVTRGISRVADASLGPYQAGPGVSAVPLHARHGRCRIAEVIGRHLDLPVVSIAAEDAADHLGCFAPSAAIDNSASSARTRQLMDWKPEQPGLLADLDQGHCFS